MPLVRALRHPSKGWSAVARAVSTAMPATNRISDFGAIPFIDGAILIVLGENFQ